MPKVLEAGRSTVIDAVHLFQVVAFVEDGVLALMLDGAVLNSLMELLAHVEAPLSSETVGGDLHLQAGHRVAREVRELVPDLKEGAVDDEGVY